MTRLRVATWNLAWKRPGGQHGPEIADRLAAVAPDIGCWTEAFADSVPGGHVATSQPDYGYPIKPGRRKVVLWSRNPWHDITTELPGAPGGRFVRSVTETAAGPVTVVGVCIPWAAAHVSTGRRDRKRWEDHLAFLQALDTMMPAGWANDPARRFQPDTAAAAPAESRARRPGTGAGRLDRGHAQAHPRGGCSDRSYRRHVGPHGVDGWRRLVRPSRRGAAERSLRDIRRSCAILKVAEVRGRVGLQPRARVATANREAMRQTEPTWT